MGFVAFTTQKHSRFRLDPRTKILLTLVISIVMMAGTISGPSAWPRAALALTPLGLLLAERKYRQGFYYMLFFLLSFAMETLFISRTQGALNLILMIIASLFSRFVPGLIMGYYLISTTRISELIAALEKIRLPQQIVIPFAVMMRFFPTVIEENAAIRDAMRMRGIRLGGAKAGAMLEYRLVPMMMCTVKIGDELSTAALTRGLGNPAKRTSLCEIRLMATDYLLMAFASCAFMLWMLL